jgi:predicted acylesterase/phospholipase RssA
MIQNFGVASSSEGGGAKGAWQFGALEALDEAGIKFDYVAGTSVGALNGALWAAGRLDLGRELWRSAAGRLQNEEMIRYTRGRVTVLDRRGLEATACECYGVVKAEYACSAA